MNQYYFVKDGQRVGPISPEEFALNGVTGETLVWTQGMTDWKAASTIPELAAYLSMAPVPPHYEPESQQKMANDWEHADAPVPPHYEPESQPQPQPQPQPQSYGYGQGGYNQGGYNQGGYGGQMYGAAGQPYTPPPGNNMVWAILSTLFCCLPFGIVSIVYASKVDNLWAMGNQQGALDAKRKSKNWAIASAVSSLVVIILYVILLVVLGVGASSYRGGW